MEELQDWWFNNGFPSQSLQITEMYGITSLYHLKLLPINNNFIDFFMYYAGMISRLGMSWNSPFLNALTHLVNSAGEDLDQSDSKLCMNESDKDIPSMLSIPFHHNIYKDIGYYIINKSDYWEKYIPFEPYELKSLYESTKCYKLLSFYI